MKRLATTMDDPLVKIMPLTNRWGYDIHTAQRAFDVFSASTGTFSTRNIGSGVMNNLVWTYYFSDEYIGLFFQTTYNHNVYILQRL